MRLQETVRRVLRNHEASHIHHIRVLFRLDTSVHGLHKPQAKRDHGHEEAVRSRASGVGKGHRTGKPDERRPVQASAPAPAGTTGCREYDEHHYPRNGRGGKSHQSGGRRREGGERPSRSGKRAENGMRKRFGFGHTDFRW